MNRRELLKSSATTIAGLGLIPGMATFMQACRNETPVDSTSFLPAQLLSDLDAMTDTILPRTQTPGASDAGVASFIDSLFGGYFDDDQQQFMKQGLESIQNNCNSTYNTSFSELPEESRQEFLSEQFRTNDFMRTLKSLTTWAYFTSETGMKSMNYQPVPGKYDGCVPVNESTKLIVGNRA